jgi:hypothetical protein
MVAGSIGTPEFGENRRLARYCDCEIDLSFFGESALILT